MTPILISYHRLPVGTAYTQTDRLYEKPQFVGFDDAITGGSVYVWLVEPHAAPVWLFGAKILKPQTRMERAQILAFESPAIYKKFDDRTGFLYHVNNSVNSSSYVVTISPTGQKRKCFCPDKKTGRDCKHIYTAFFELFYERLHPLTHQMNFKELLPRVQELIIECVKVLSAIPPLDVKPLQGVERVKV